jgi:hypothetical protein
VTQSHEQNTDKTDVLAACLTSQKLADQTVSKTKTITETSIRIRPNDTCYKQNTLQYALDLSSYWNQHKERNTLSITQIYPNTIPTTCNITLRWVHETTAVVENNKFDIFLCVWVCVRVCVREGMRMRVWLGGCGCRIAGVCLRACRLTYPVCHAQASYCLRPLQLRHIFRHCLINGTIFRKKLLNVKWVF